ncbi:hypothetical protein THF1C08_320007 [Vibrio jasicida]|nr:hypothetical protein THF1C08_320007 [Vibrio jasicida]
MPLAFMAGARRNQVNCGALWGLFLKVTGHKSYNISPITV